MKNLPKKIPVFPLSNFIIFPKTTVPLNIFEKRYIDMVNDSMKSNKLIGMIQPKITKDNNKINPQLYEIGCLGKITSFKETEDGRYLIELKGLIRFQITNEVQSGKKYREFEINFEHSKLDFPVVITSSTTSTLDFLFILKSLLKRNLLSTLSQNIVSIFNNLPIS